MPSRLDETSYFRALRTGPRRGTAKTKETAESMPIRQHNVTAAKWNVNGNAIGAPDLTLSDNQVFGANVFSQAIQRQRLPKDVFRKLSRTLAKGEALDTSLADAVALAMKEWAWRRAPPTTRTSSSR